MTTRSGKLKGIYDALDHANYKNAVAPIDSDVQQHLSSVSLLPGLQALYYLPAEAACSCAIASTRSVSRSLIALSSLLSGMTYGPFKSVWGGLLGHSTQWRWSAVVGKMRWALGSPPQIYERSRTEPFPLGNRQCSCVRRRFQQELASTFLWTGVVEADMFTRGATASSAAVAFLDETCLNTLQARKKSRQSFHR